MHLHRLRDNTLNIARSRRTCFRGVTEISTALDVKVNFFYETAFMSEERLSNKSKLHFYLAVFPLRLKYEKLGNIFLHKSIFL